MRLFFGILLLSVLASQAATNTAESTSQSNVQAAVTAALSGDTVIIPVGTSTWSSAISLAKAITINGSGTNSTVIQNNQSASTGYDRSIFNIRLSSIEADKPLTIRGIKFVALQTMFSSGMLVTQ